jgi:O-antigen/teichoic acid export membrane protein
MRRSRRRTAGVHGRFPRERRLTSSSMTGASREAPVESPEPEAPRPARGRTARRGDFVSTFLTNVLVIVTGVLVYRFASRLLGPEGFSEYSLSRRATSFALPPLMAGLGYAIPRYVALGEYHEEGDQSVSYFAASMLIVAASLAAVLLPVNLVPSLAARFVFGDARYAGFVPALSLAVVGLCSHGVAYAYFRGKMSIVRSNLLLMLNYVAIPLAAFYASGGSARAVIGWTGALTSLVSLAAVASILVRRRRAIRGVGGAVRTLATYGLPRVPGDFAQSALFAAPAFFAAHTAGLHAAGMVAFGSTLITLAGTAFNPISIIFLPFSVHLLRDGRHRELRARMNRIVALSVAAVSAGVLVLEVALPWVVRLYLGPGFESSVGIVRIMMVAAIPFIVHVVLHAVNDAGLDQAVNSYGAYAAVASFVALAGLGLAVHPGIGVVLAAFVASVCVLAGVTWWNARRVLGGEVSPALVAAASAPPVEAAC